MGQRKVPDRDGGRRDRGGRLFECGHDPGADDGAAGQPGRRRASAGERAGIGQRRARGQHRTRARASSNLVVWPGYAEDGSNVKEYDWVNPFMAATRLQGQRQDRRHVGRDGTPS